MVLLFSFWIRFCRAVLIKSVLVEICVIAIASSISSSGRSKVVRIVSSYAYNISLMLCIVNAKYMHLIFFQRFIISCAQRPPNIQLNLQSAHARIRLRKNLGALFAYQCKSKKRDYNSFIGFKRAFGAPFAQEKQNNFN